MDKKIKLAYTSLCFAILMPLAISVFLIDKSYKLEKRKFDFEVIKYSAEVFYSFTANYSLLDSVIQNTFFEKADTENKTISFDELEKELKKAYSNYKSIADSFF